MKKAFSLVELMIVVAVIGILAAMVIPKVQDYTTQAKEAAAKENLHILRDAIELYATKHNGIPPGYYNNDPVHYTVPVNAYFVTQLCDAMLISTVSKNPFNGNTFVQCLRDNADFPSDATGAWGYIYKPATETIKLDAVGTDSQGIRYFDY
jgi:prepilin-type N-terminal cleavage/methylation domain-containing protein